MIGPYGLSGFGWLFGLLFVVLFALEGDREQGVFLVVVVFPSKDYISKGSDFIPLPPKNPDVSPSFFTANLVNPKNTNLNLSI